MVIMIEEIIKEAFRFLIGFGAVFIAIFFVNRVTIY